MSKAAKASRLQTIANRLAQDLWKHHRGNLVACLAGLALDVADHNLGGDLVRAVIGALGSLDRAPDRAVIH